MTPQPLTLASHAKISGVSTSRVCSSSSRRPPSTLATTDASAPAHTGRQDRESVCASGRGGQGMQQPDKVCSSGIAASSGG